MQFLVIGLDGKDRKASKRRQTAHSAHVKVGEKLRVAGNLWYGAALLDKSGNKNGSMYLVDFPNRTKLREWLEKEPYVTGRVWKKVDIRTCNVNEPWQFNRPIKFFKSKKS